MHLDNKYFIRTTFKLEKTSITFWFNFNKYLDRYVYYIQGVIFNFLTRYALLNN